MAQSNITLTSSTRTVTLPYYARDGLKERIEQNVVKKYTLSGSMYVDYFNTRGGWDITFDVLTIDQYNEIRAVYDDQITNAEFLVYEDPDMGITDLRVFLNMPNERSVSYNKQAVIGLTINLEPESASS